MKTDLVSKKIELQHYFQSLYPAIKGEPPQFRTRCILCGDSKKDPNKMRLGIKIDATNPEEPILYRCFNCNRSGILTNRMLKAITGAQQIKTSVDGINRSILKSSGNIKTNRYKNTRVINVKIPGLYPKDLNKAKYVFGRLGRIIDPKEHEGLKIIWSLYDFLSVNNLKSNSKMDWLLDRDYVGFLSTNNDFISFRDITDKNKFRWYKYNIFEIFDNSASFYSIPGRLELFTPEDIHIHIAEGPFDILSILYNINDNNRTNNLYISSTDGEFYTPLLHYFEKGFVGSNIFIDVYKDNVKYGETEYDYGKLKTDLKTYVINTKNIHIYYNAHEGEKDFGVPLSKIIKEEYFL